MLWGSLGKVRVGGVGMNNPHNPGLAYLGNLGTHIEIDRKIKSALLCISLNLDV